MRHGRHSCFSNGHAESNGTVQNSSCAVLRCVGTGFALAKDMVPRIVCAQLAVDQLTRSEVVSYADGSKLNTERALTRWHHNDWASLDIDDCLLAVGVEREQYQNKKSAVTMVAQTRRVIVPSRCTVGSGTHKLRSNKSIARTGGYSERANGG